jgi:phosphatidylserine/phosphatidylglycerophosphate/cardiolipin synthase-like enzyme
MSTHHGYDADNNVTYHYDGVDVFTRVQQIMDGMKGDGYVHMSFLTAEAATLFGNKSFADTIKAVAARGNPVKILLWQPSFVELQTPAPWIGAANDSNNECKTLLDAPPNVEVRVVLHADSTAVAHQKTMIFNTGDGVIVMVGGLNMEMDERDRAPHSMPGKYHDIAVEFSGPSTVDVETDFNDRWRRGRGAQPSKPEGPGPVVPPGPDPQAIYVGTTDTDTTPMLGVGVGPLGLPYDVVPTKSLELKAELLACIKGAESYVYMENYSIHDAEIIQALGEKIAAKKAAGQPFYAILLTRDPAAELVYSWLHYITYLQLSFMSCDALNYVDQPNHLTGVQRSATTAWSFERAGKWYQDSKFTWTSSGASGSAGVSQLPTFVGPETPLYKALYVGGGGAAGATTTNYVYIHSKVAIIDDKYAAIGSANFNPRSMNVDGELDAFITGDSVKGFRKKLWDEWFPGDSVEPATWESRVSTNEGGILTAGRHWVLSIRPSEYAKGPPNRSGMAAIFDEANRW